ncbi:MAG: multicopper oxidase domain-containing protein, partial [Verrucomicrobiota bacterium]
MSILAFFRSRGFRLGLFGLGLATLGLGAGLYWAIFAQVVNDDRGFENTLKIPPLMQFEEPEKGTKAFDLVVSKGITEFFDGKPTETWGVNGAYLGPTIRAKKGERLILKVRNLLDEATTMHWHGMHVPAAMDGTPHQNIDPGEEWTADYRVTQEAGTMWYHPHAHGRTATQVYRGIAGLIYLDDDNSEGLDLPSEYGVDDIPLVIQDRLFGEDGSMRYQIRSGAYYGDEILVNGTHDPHVEVEARKIRFRILNGSNARIYHFGFTDGRRFQQIATDGGFLEAPVDTDRARLAPGERVEIVVDFSDGESCVLRSFPEGPLWDAVGGLSGRTMNQQFDIIEMRVKPATRESHRIPEKLNTIARLKREDADKERPMVMGGMVINGKSMNMMRIDERIQLGDTEVWRVQNVTGRSHPFHVHLVQFLVLDRNGRPPSPLEAGWKDTVLLHSGDAVNIIMKFDQYADPKVPYMYHCHILEHEDMA